MNRDLPKAYIPQDFEESLYKTWIESDYFNPDSCIKNGVTDKDAPVFSVMMPPPNVTGILHLGHAFENTIMDIQTRYQRLLGKRTLWVPGTDHAAVATQARVEKKLIEEEGYTDPRKELGREKLLEIIREYAENSQATIINQVKRLGASCDWSRLAFTFDDVRSKTVNEIFVRMYNDELIYQGTRMVNWSVGAQSVLSDDELEWDELKEPFYYIRCGEFIIGTIRPETKCADSPVIVHPEGKYVRLAFTDKDGNKDTLIVSKNLFDNTEQFNLIINNLHQQSEFEVIETKTGKELEGISFEYETYAGARKFYVLADEVIDMDKGAGAMTISTNHSADDYDLAQRKDLKETYIEKINFEGLMTQIAGPCAGMTIAEARVKSAEIMKEKGLIIGEDAEYVHRVPLCYRSKTVVEPMISKQWFIDVNKEIPNKGKTLKNLMKEAVTSGHNGDAEQIIKILPDRFTKVYFNWIDNLRDWCISRQIWWGHQIPVWYHKETGELHVSETGPTDPENYTQDPDTLDTWFSSGTWTFSTLGWPEKTADLETYHTTTWMQMGYEILFFWMARMILMSTYALDEIPFKDVYIHGMVRDKQGRKFSKSLDNGIDPLEMIDKYGTDALRLALIADVTPGQDSRFYEDKVEYFRNLVNKLWNISRFIMMSVEKISYTPELTLSEDKLSLSDKWILTELNTAIETTTDLLNKYQFSLALESLRDFTWNKFADWYIEIAKLEENKDEVLNYILQNILRLWHPYAPFITEHIWSYIKNKPQDLLMVDSWPQQSKISEDEKTLHNFNLIQETISTIRNARAEKKIEPAKKIVITIDAKNNQELFTNQEHVIKGLARIETINYSSQKPEHALTVVVEDIEISLHLDSALDLEAEKERIQKEIDNLTGYITGLEKKLSNEQFVQNAPEQVVQQEKEKLQTAQEKLETLQKQL